MCKRQTRMLVGRKTPRSRTGFTLIELLTVIAIITLLIGILVPALSRAREQAKSAATRAVLKSAGDGLDMFKNENPKECRGGDGYPDSANRDDPTEEDYQDIFGAQWLVRYLMGKTLDGYIPKRNVPRDLLTDAEEHFEQGHWYDSDTTDNPYAPLDRVGPYLESTAVELEQPCKLEGAEEALSLLEPDAARWKQPVILDAFGTPVLYYSSNTRMVKAKRGGAQIVAFGCFEGTCYGSEEYYKGAYTFSDNAIFTGLCGNADGSGGTSACYASPWDFAGVGTAEENHKLSQFGTFEPDSITDDVNTFAYYVLDKSVWDATYDETADKGTVVPYRSESFILISPGPDGIYGTMDDVKNF